MSYNSPGIIIKNKSVRKLRPNRDDRLCYYRELFLRKLRSRFRFKEFSYEANYKFFKLAYEVGTSAIYLPNLNLENINKYDALLVFNYQISNGVKTKNNLPLTIKPTPEEIKNSGGILPNEELEIGKDVVLFWTHSTNHMSDALIIDKIFAKKLVDIDEVKDNVVTSSQTPIIISYRNKDNREANNLIESVTNNNMVGYISDQEIGNIKPFQLSFDAHNYITALQSEKTSLTDEALATFGFSNLGRGETAKKERLLTDEVKVESDATNEALFDYIHQLEEFAKRFEDCFKLKLTPLISINGAFVDLETGHKYYKIKGAGGSAEQLGEILSGYNEFSGNTVDFGRSANTFTQKNSSNDLGANYGPDTEDRQYNNNWLNNLNLGNYTYIPYEPNGPSYTQALFGNVWNMFMRGLNLYRSNDDINEQNSQNNINNNYFSFNNQNNSLRPNLVNPSLPFFYRLVNYVARRNFNTLDNQYQHLNDIDESKPITKQDLLKNLDNVFSEKTKDYQSTIKYYFYLLQAYIKAGISLSLPSLLIASFIATSYYFNMSDNSINNVFEKYVEDWNKLLPQEKNWAKLFGENYKHSISKYEEEQMERTGFKKLGVALLHTLFTPFRAVKVAAKTSFYKNILPNLINNKYFQKISVYLLNFLIRNIVYSFSYRVSYSLLDFLNKDESPIAKHYITTFNAALTTGYFADQKDYRTGLKYALSTTLSHHLQTILYFANKLNRVEKNKIIRLLNKWNDNIIFLFPKDVAAYFISSYIVDAIIETILDPNEGFVKKSSKFFINTLSKITSFTYETFSKMINLILEKPIGLIQEFDINDTSNYLANHFDFILNYLQDTTIKFYESLKDYLMMSKHPLMLLNKIKNENMDILDESDNNIINQNPIDLENERREIEQEAQPIIKDFVNNMVAGRPYDEAANNAIDNNLSFLNQMEIQDLKIDLVNLKEKIENIKNQVSLNKMMPIINKSIQNIDLNKKNPISKIKLSNIYDWELKEKNVYEQLSKMEKQLNGEMSFIDNDSFITNSQLENKLKKYISIMETAPELLNNNKKLFDRINYVRNLYNKKNKTNL